MTDGGDITQDFALDALPTVDVSGTVRDGGGHGYPLYARIDVSGAPIGPLYTDPMTGHYAVTLFQETAYTFKVAAALPGYQVLVSDQSFVTATATLDFNMLVDQQTCTAPGYHAVVGGIYEIVRHDDPARGLADPPAGQLRRDDVAPGRPGTPWQPDGRDRSIRDRRQ